MSILPILQLTVKLMEKVPAPAPNLDPHSGLRGDETYKRQPRRVRVRCGVCVLCACVCVCVYVRGG